jgi:hypothetical protein
MTSRLRIARLDPDGYAAVGDGAPTREDHRRLDALIRRHLPPVTASLLAEPRPTADGRFIEWYSDLAGQPRRLAALPEAEREAARALLADRLRSLADLADQLPRIDPAAAPLAQPLKEALSYPGEETVYLVGDQPVLTFWGHRPLATPATTPAAAPAVVTAAPPPDAVTTATEAPAAADQRRFPTTWAAALALLLLLGLAAWGAYQGLGWGWRWPPWGPDLEALLQAADDEESRLRREIAEREEALRGRLEVCAAERALAAATEESARLRGRLDVLERRLSERLALCPLSARLKEAQVEGRALGQRLSGIEVNLRRAIDECRREAEAAKRKAEEEKRKAEAEKRRADEAKRKAELAEQRRAAQQKPPPAAVPPADDRPKPPPERQGLPPCPGERTPEEAPDVAMVLDASGSMGFPASATAADIAQQLGRVGGLPGLLGSILLQQSSGPSRLDEAKKGVNSVVRSLPSDVDVGLAVLQRCPRADNLGFFSSPQRGQLLSRVAGLRPMQGTPLAQGIEEAGGMVDGVKAPAVLVVISDGEDSCGGDPCATARALKARKPNLTINVVDILGNGAANCLANATGGRVLTPEDGLAFEKTIKRAAEQALKPAHCP